MVPQQTDVVLTVDVDKMHTPRVTIIMRRERLPLRKLLLLSVDIIRVRDKRHRAGVAIFLEDHHVIIRPRIKPPEEKVQLVVILVWIGCALPGADTKQNPAILAVVSIDPVILTTPLLREPARVDSASVLFVAGPVGRDDKVCRLNNELRHCSVVNRIIPDVCHLGVPVVIRVLVIGEVIGVRDPVLSGTGSRRIHIGQDDGDILRLAHVKDQLAELRVDGGPVSFEGCGARGDQGRQDDERVGHVRGAD